ncbi:DUF262 domain-containing protein [Pseudomonas fulva]|uniref:DUF262 domain-containing protein n=1 Tax=Pseudomonas fulva TaxID=47880 RepID=UPI003461A1CF
MQLSDYDRGFRFKKDILSVSALLSRFSEGGIYLYPDHIYSKEWHRRSKSAFIESLLLGMPTTEIWCEEDNYGGVSVLDGTQRIQAILDFCHNNFELSELKLIPELSGCRYSDLPYQHTFALLNRTDIYFTTISYDTHAALKFEFFKRINSDSYRFPVQAARNFAFRDHFSFIKYTQKTCEWYLTTDDETYTFSTKKDYRDAASFDELFLLMAAVTLTYHSELSTKSDSISDFLDEAAMRIHFGYFRDLDLSSEIEKTIENICESLESKIQYNPRKSLSSMRRPRHHYNDDRLMLTSSQIIELFIPILKHGPLHKKHTDDILAHPQSLSPLRTTSSIYRKLFSQ